eukprot:CAMPEP_0119324036 /NCGR_PEP_ID=MMETSP1333-20130426/62206_1 /TAXON_ID=418940 /ORGANISM="Scyphosphaera apsteinii, Strain RCC1455" /LENGTH=40 /DNA_ID= /DNA_START= /DNA_END= /DNA_ORIENTATION=
MKDLQPRQPETPQRHRLQAHAMAAGSNSAETALSLELSGH